MSNTRHRIFAVAAWAVLAACAPAQEIEAYIPAIALPPEPMGSVPPIPATPTVAPIISNPTRTTTVAATKPSNNATAASKPSNNIDPVGYFPTRKNSTPPPATPAPTTSSTSLTSSASLSVPMPAASAPPITFNNQRWRWYGYGSVNGRAAAGPAVFTGTVSAPTGMAAAIDAPSAAGTATPSTPSTGTPASIGIPMPMTAAPNQPTTPLPAPAMMDGPPITQTAPATPAADTPKPAEPVTPFPPPPVEPWSGPISIANTTWQPATVRASSAH